MNEDFNRLANLFPFIVKWESQNYGWCFTQLQKAEATEAPYDAIYYREGEEGEHIDNGWHKATGITNDSALRRMGIAVPAGLQTYNQIRSIIHDLTFGLQEIGLLNEDVGNAFSGVQTKMVSDLEFYENVLGRIKSKGLLDVMIDRCECPENEGHIGECATYSPSGKNPECKCH